MQERVRRPAPCDAAPYVGALVLTAFGGMGLQVVAMGYGQEPVNLAVVWFLVGSGLFLLVQAKRSRFAHGLLLTACALGAAIYLPGVSHAHLVTVMFVAFLIQLAALGSPPVRRHVAGLRW